MKQDTYIVSRESFMNTGYVVGASPIPKKVSEPLFEAQRVIESQFMPKMPVIVLYCTPPKQAIHVAEDTYLIPLDEFEFLDEVNYFLVNQPFCKALDEGFLDIFNLLTSDPDKVLELDVTYMIGCTDA